MIGKVAAVQNFGAGDILELAGPGLNGDAGAVHQGRGARGRCRSEDDNGRQHRGRPCRRSRWRRANRTFQSAEAAVSIRSAVRVGRAMPEATGELPRQRADALPRNVSGTARPVARRPRARGRNLVAGAGPDPRFRRRQAPHRRRYAGRRRRRHGDACRHSGQGDRLCRAGRRSAPAPADEPARQAADAGAGARARGWGQARSSSAAASKASTSG